MRAKLFFAFPWIVTSVFLVSLASCGGTGGPTSAGEVQGSDQVTGQAVLIPPGAVDPNSGSGCEGKKENQICLALKYVVYKDSSGTPVVSETEAKSLVSQIN